MSLRIVPASSLALFAAVAVAAAPLPPVQDIKLPRAGH